MAANYHHQETSEGRAQLKRGDIIRNILGEGKVWGAVWVHNVVEQKVKYVSSSKPLMEKAWYLVSCPTPPFITSKNTFKTITKKQALQRCPHIVILRWPLDSEAQPICDFISNSLSRNSLVASNTSLVDPEPPDRCSLVWNLANDGARRQTTPPGNTSNCGSMALRDSCNVRFLRAWASDN